MGECGPMNTESYTLTRLVHRLRLTAFPARARQRRAGPAPLLSSRARPWRSSPTARGGLLGAQVSWATAPGRSPGPATEHAAPAQRSLARAGAVLLCGVVALALATTVKAAGAATPPPPPPAPAGDGTTAPSPTSPTDTAAWGGRQQASAAPHFRPSSRTSGSRAEHRLGTTTGAHRRRPAAPPPGAVPGARSWPVGTRPRVARGWEPPATGFGPGHRGVDLRASVGTTVRAAASGRVSFAGPVAGRGVVAIELSGSGEPPLRTTYEPVRPLVAVGDEVVAGQPVAVLESSTHCPHSCLHWGLLRGKDYLDPFSLLPEWMLRRGPSRLLPVSGVPEPSPGIPQVLAPRPKADTPTAKQPHAPAEEPGRGRQRPARAVARRSTGKTGPAGRSHGRPATSGPPNRRGRVSRTTDKRGRVSRGRRRGPSPRSRR